ncbi:hypothetical protein [Halapricum desulfuricans]|uniref:Small-conductance mechanosensitive channel n=1 Tax=Halapricum desulfuricans TaxID=2841257 RepID=A0A897N635_9EURY|nr:hypothetical protein [Halapricum desulfuricans]QSG06673.1 Small-conductance mechanosensitive channel [Halapricum desulfuricans]
MTGTVESIGLRKSRPRLDSGELVVLANRTVESRWTRLSSSAKASTDQ